MTDRADLPRLEDLPIPENPAIGGGWTPDMLEMADHIGHRAVLLLSDRLGGELVRVPLDPRRGRITPVVGDDLGEVMSRVYGGERLTIPIARQALLVARRAPILAAVRQRKLTGDDAARILRMRRRSISRLVNESEEGLREPLPAQPLKGAIRDPRQLFMFEDD